MKNAAVDRFAESKLVAGADDGFLTQSTWNYLLLSNDQCVTPWHIDFASTSVFYVVLLGEKIFWLVEPTRKNLRLFKQYSEKDPRSLLDIISWKKTIAPTGTWFCKNSQMKRRAIFHPTRLNYNVCLLEPHHLETWSSWREEAVTGSMQGQATLLFYLQNAFTVSLPMATAWH